MTQPAPEAEKRQARMAAIVIVAAMMIWFGAAILGGELGLPVRFAILLDLACMAAMVWALVVLFRIWRRRQDNGV